MFAQDVTADVFTGLKVSISDNLFDASDYVIGQLLEPDAVRRRQPEFISGDFAHK
jgi:hypothetical protein